MKTPRFALAFGCVLAVGVAFAADTGRARNFERTRTYYEQVLKDPSRGAELALLMTMLPKGGDLHHHYTGAIYAETYLDWVGRQGYCVRPDTLQIETTPPPEPSTATAQCLGADEVRKNETLYRAVLMRWSDKDFANHDHEQPPPDQQFFDTFGFFGATSGYSPHEGLEMLKRRALAENVQYIETMLRGAPHLPTHPEAAALDGLTADTAPSAIDAALAGAFDALERDDAAQEAIRHYKAGLAADTSGIDGSGFMLRVQTYMSRNNSPSQTFTGLYGAFKAAQNDPVIVGVNIVGPENGVVAMRDYALHMRMFHFLETRFPSTHLAMHAGELAVGMVPPEGLRDHIRLAVEEAGAQRVGHGVDIAHEDGAWDLLAEMRRRGVTVEINLTSNAFILGIEGDSHPVTLYRRAGVPIVISTDDAGVSRSSLSNEYALFAGRYKPSYAELKHIVYDSIRQSFLSVPDKQRQLRELDARFARFEADVAARQASR